VYGIRTSAAALIATGLISGGCVGSVDAVVEGDPIVRVLRKNAIRSIDRPRMISAVEAAELLVDHEPVLGVHDGERARAYPLWYLDAHEIVNDWLGDVPIAATW
jgi:hypothetical protein